MKLKNNSARPHWLGNVMIAPLSIEEVGEEWRNAYNKKDLEEVIEAGKPGRKPKAKVEAEAEEAETEQTNEVNE